MILRHLIQEMCIKYGKIDTLAQNNNHYVRKEAPALELKVSHTKVSTEHSREIRTDRM